MIKKLILQLKPLRDRIDALSLRERGLMFVAVMVVLYMIAANLIFTPLRLEQAKVQKDLAAKQNQIASLSRQIEAVIGRKDEDPDKDNQAKLVALQAQLQQMDANLGEMTKGFVSPREMARLVEQILKKNRRLEVLKLENLPPVAIGESEAADPGAAGRNAVQEREALVYKHGLRMELRGRYFDIVDYLKTLEALEWKVFWGQVRLDSEDYPVSELTLVIYTLSAQPGWIGV